jgi:hypothetical protein
MQISAFSLDMNKKDLPSTFFLKILNGWGWATWANRWQKLNHDAADLFKIVNEKGFYDAMTIDRNEPDYYNQLKSDAEGTSNHWDIKWFSSVVVNEGLCLYPKESLVVNIGLDGSGTHFKNGEKGHHTILTKSKILLSKQKLIELPMARKSLVKYFKSRQPTFFDKAKFKLNLLKNKYFGK